MIRPLLFGLLGAVILVLAGHQGFKAKRERDELLEQLDDLHRDAMTP